MKKTLIIILSSLCLNNIIACERFFYECTIPSSNTVIINQEGNDPKVLYASISNAHCVNSQALTSFTNTTTFDLPIHTKSRCDEHDYIYYHINVYEKEDGTIPVTNAKISMPSKCNASEKICPLNKKILTSSSKNYTAKYDIDGTIITVTITAKVSE